MFPKRISGRQGETVTVYDALLSDGAGKRARAESVDSLPTAAQIWYMLRQAYGATLVSATLVAVNYLPQNYDRP